MNFHKRNVLAAMLAGTVIPVAAAAGPAFREDETDDVPFAVWAAINAATQGYADCIDRFDITGLVALFAPDCVYDYAPGLMMQGRDAVAAGARKSLAEVARSSHAVGPPVVSRDDEPGSYRSVAYFTAVHEHKDGGHHTVCGRYIDLFRPDAANRLLIAHRHTVGHVAEGTQAARYWLARQPS